MMGTGLVSDSILEAIAPLIPLPPMPKINAFAGVQPLKSMGLLWATSHACLSCSGKA